MALLAPATVIGRFDQSDGRLRRRIRFDHAGVFTLAVRVTGPMPAQVLLDDSLLAGHPGVVGVAERGHAGAQPKGLLFSLATLTFEPGDFDLELNAPGSSVDDLLQLERDTDETRYLAVARAHGFDEGTGTAPVDEPGVQKNFQAVKRLL